MANMSYVAFENTTRALEQCIDLMESEINGDHRLSPREFVYAQTLLIRFGEYTKTMQELVQSRSDKVESSK